jgi:soluble lytic murein transglycosylase-like protein
MKRLVQIAAPAALVLVAGLVATPANAYVDADVSYDMALHHNHPTDGRARNYRVAMLLYCRADADGHANSDYAGEHGFKQNQASASAWFKRASALGHPEGASMAKIFRQRGKRGSARCPNGWGRTARAKLYAPQEIRALVAELAPKYGLDPKLVLAVIQVESAYQTNVVSPANAQGPMRLIPATATRFGVRDAFNPTENIHGGMRYLRWLLKRFKGYMTKTVAAYDAGEGAMKKYDGVPPYRETQNYVRKIRRLYAKLRHPV